FLRQPTAHGAAAQPVVFEKSEFLEVLEALDVLARIEVELEERILARGGFDPERRAGFGVEVLLDGLAHVGVELFLGFFRGDAHWGPNLRFVAWVRWTFYLPFAIA